MNVDHLSEFESDQKILSELKSLFEFTSPGKLRRSLEDAIFNLLSVEEDLSLPNEKSLIRDFYFLINFLNEVENENRF